MPPTNDVVVTKNQLVIRINFLIIIIGLVSELDAAM